MDPRLLRYYNQELQHLRDMGAEFAKQFPKIAARLRMDGIEVGDPYIERLLEGFAFLAARIQLKLDAEFPRFTERLLEIVYPNYLAPTPSMMVAQVQPALGDASLATGPRVPRGSELRSGPIRGTHTECRFRTAHDLALWPLEITAVSYFTHAANLPLARQPELRRYAGGLRIRVRATAGLDLGRISLQDLRLFCSGSDEIAYKLHELVCGNTLGAVVLPTDGAAPEQVLAEPVRAVGFEDEQALLPVTLTGFGGYRLLQEYFAFPQRFLFFDLVGLGPTLRAVGGTEAEIVLLFGRGDPTLQQAVDRQSLALHCVPAINLFEQRCDRIPVTPGTHDFHVVVDRARPMDFEVIDLVEVSGYGQGQASEKRFMPLYAAFHTEELGHDAYYATQREPRLLAEKQRREGTRSSYVGSEVFLTIVDAAEAPYAGSLQQLGVKALCSNRDLPLAMATSEGGLRLDLTAPVDQVRVVKGPSRPLTATREGRLAWRFINQLSLNHLSLLDTDAEHGAAALRELLRLYTQEGDHAQLRLIEGLRSIRAEPVVRRLPLGGPIAFGRGVRIDVEVDDLAFQGASPFLFGCVLERYFARHVSMNGFTEIRLRSPARGEILVGKPTIGARPVL
ncbi:MAG: type VI secretion system baseplate subunit TssF [Rubrivivax sp.]|jgi:type VI secretion system protein ImpG|nr:type VI secretion system baseplate subunit TssF [Rubrivivax sp.]